VSYPSGQSRSKLAAIASVLYDKRRLPAGDSAVVDPFVFTAYIFSGGGREYAKK
jgi:hypothetical protein